MSKKVYVICLGEEWHFVGNIDLFQRIVHPISVQSEHNIQLVVVDSDGKFPVHYASKHKNIITFSKHAARKVDYNSIYN